MRFLSFAAALGVCGSVLGAPVEQKPLASSDRGPRVFKTGASSRPFTPGHRDPYDRKVDAPGNKLHPLPWVSLTCTLLRSTVGEDCGFGCTSAPRVG